MRNKIFIVQVILAVLFSISAVFAQVEKPQVNVYKLTENLFRITIYGLNSLVLTGEGGALIVDPGYEQVTDLLIGEINKLGSDKVKYAINTHWHFDHVGGDKNLDPDVTIIAHETVKELLSSDRNLLGEKIEAHRTEVLPDLVIDSTFTIDFNGEKVKIIPVTGGHTGGDIIVYFENANVLHIGDIIFADMFPFVDVENGGNVFKMRKNILKIIEMMPYDVTIIPGHGRNYSVEDASNYCKMIENTTSIVCESIEKGITPEEMKEKKILVDWVEWNKGFSCDDWIEMIFKSKN